MIVPVDKYSTSVDPETEQIISNAKTTDTLFLFSRKEVTGQEDNGTNSPIYTFFSSNMYNRIRYKKDQDESVSWALRNAVDRAAFGQIIWKSGNYGSTMNPSAGGTLVYGFCLDA